MENMTIKEAIENKNYKAIQLFKDQMETIKQKDLDNKMLLIKAFLILQMFAYITLCIALIKLFG